MATFGNTNAEAGQLSAANPIGCKFTVAEGGTITKITANFRDFDTTGDGHCAIYDDDGGSGRPGTKLAQSTATSITGNGWFDFTTSYVFTAGTYFLMTWTSAAAISAVTPGASSDQTSFQSGPSFPTWPDPFVESGGLDYTLSIYATYTAAGGGAGKNLLMMGVGDISAAGLIVGGPALWRYRRILAKQGQRG